MVVILRNVVALQICEVNARNGHEYIALPQTF